MIIIIIIMWWISLSFMPIRYIGCFSPRNLYWRCFKILIGWSIIPIDDTCVSGNHVDGSDGCYIMHLRDTRIIAFAREYTSQNLAPCLMTHGPGWETDHIWLIQQRGVDGFLGHWKETIQFFWNFRSIF